jgi:hypothetical protein
VAREILIFGKVRLIFLTEGELDTRLERDSLLLNQI